MTCNVGNTYSDSFVFQKDDLLACLHPYPFEDSVNHPELTEKEFCVFSAAIPQWEEWL